MLDKLINNLDDNLDTELLAILKQVNLLNNSISGSVNNASSFKKRKDILKNRLQRYYQYYITLFSPLGDNL